MKECAKNILFNDHIIMGHNLSETLKSSAH